jgi:hypothetical protein
MGHPSSGHLAVQTIDSVDLEAKVAFLRQTSSYPDRAYRVDLAEHHLALCG